MARTTEQTPEQAEWVVALDTASVGDHVIRAGERRLADDPVVEQSPGLWVAEETSPEELTRIRQDRLGDAFADAAGSRYAGNGPTILDQPEPSPDRMVATTEFYAPDASGAPDRVMVGRVLDLTDNHGRALIDNTPEGSLHTWDEVFGRFER